MKQTIVIVGAYANILENAIDTWYQQQFSILKSASVKDMWQNLSVTTPQEMHSILLCLSSTENEECVQTLQDWSIEGFDLRKRLTLIIVAEEYAEQQCRHLHADGWLNMWPPYGVIHRIKRLVTQHEHTIQLV